MRCVVDQRGLESVSINDCLNNRFRSDDRDSHLMNDCFVKAWSHVVGCVVSSSLFVSMSLGSLFWFFRFEMLFLLFRGLLVVAYFMM